MNDQTYQNQLRRVYDAFRDQPRTMLQVADQTGILRSNICRYVAHLEKLHKITIVKKGKCPISKHQASFYSTNPALIPKPGQAEMFPTKHQGVYSQ